MRVMVAKWFDGLAVGASVLCLIHCLALPIVIAALPALAARLDLARGSTLLFWRSRYRSARLRWVTGGGGIAA